MKTTKLLATTLILASLAGSFTASPALANDGKAYPGSMCVLWGNNRHPAYSVGAIGNLSTTEPLFIDCPVEGYRGQSPYISTLLFYTNIHLTLSKGL